MPTRRKTSRKTRPKEANRLFLLALAAAAVLSLGVVFLSSEEGKETAAACQPNSFSGLWEDGEEVAIFEGQRIAAPDELPVLLSEGQAQVLGSFSGQERWIEVDLSEQKLRAWEGNSLFLETPVSTGLPWWPTPTGEFRIWIKLRATKMEGGTGRNYYYLPNVPYVMFFENDQVPGRRGYGLHGTYWHNDFGRPKSHGCVNLPTPVAERLYYWTTSKDATNLGTRIVIHE